ncbi:Z1 domain-containing protein [Streptomyces olivaceus]|uniref:Z1 domain-containing protein n=1 Tax=Streptomyces olivaceus TaxID=47716 RepID=UPI00364DD458
MNHSDTPTPLSQRAGRALTMLADDMAGPGGADPRRALWMRSLEHLSAGGAPASADDAKVVRFLELLEMSSVAGPSPDELVEPPVVIGRATRSSWPSRRDGFWGNYRRFLRDDQGWGELQIATLDASSGSILEQLAAPEGPVTARTRGLVVSSVGSGKTANFIGVIAKAVDAGYRLVIVVTGPLNLQRHQVQQRLERALLGDGPPDGAGTGTANPQGRVPKTRPGMMRVTTLDHDYGSIGSAKNPWDFVKPDPEQPLNSPHNLRRTPVRLLAVKKNKTVLSKLIRDLRASNGPLSELPALVIDEESYEAADWATDKKGIGQSAADGQLVQLLQLLPRAQYVKYSTTPFARALVDPTREEELFPHDFVAYLPQAVEYLRGDGTNNPTSQEADWTRLKVPGLYPALPARVVDTGDLGSPPETGSQGSAAFRLLSQAVDMFVLTGALKLYRQQTGQYTYRHHTMLVHGGDRLVDQHQVLERLRRQWDPAAFAHRENRARLKALFEQDILRHLSAYPEAQCTPDAFEDLLPYIRAAADRMTRLPQLITGAQEEWRDLQEEFADREVWGVLVSGAKVAHVLRPAGLTINFAYPKGSRTAKKLMMDERFVNREGYRDLLRCYIGHDTGKAEMVEEAERLEELRRAEEGFRARLREIAVHSVHDPLTPAQLPALVAHHAPWRARARRNRIFNAELVEIRSPGRWVEHLARPARAADRVYNARAWLLLLQMLDKDPSSLAVRGRHTAVQMPFELPARAGVVSHEQLLDVLERLRWQRPEAFQPYLQYLRSLRGHLDEWVVILPQQTGEGATTQAAKSQLLRPALLQSSDLQAFLRLEDQRHRRLGERIVEMGRQVDPDPFARGKGESGSRRGVLFLHPMTDRGLSGALIEGQHAVSPEQLVMGISYLVPTDGSSQLVRFTPRNASQAEAPILASASTLGERIAPQPLSAAV